MRKLVQILAVFAAFMLIASPSYARTAHHAKAKNHHEMVQVAHKKHKAKRALSKETSVRPVKLPKILEQPRIPNTRGNAAPINRKP